MPKKFEVRLEIDENAKSVIEELARRPSFKGDQSQVFKHALALLSTAAQQKDTGGKIIFRHVDGKEESLDLSHY